MDMPITVPRASVTRGRRRPQGPRRALAAVSRSRVGDRQGRPGRHAHRSRAAGYGRDLRQLPATGTVAAPGDEYADAARQTRLILAALEERGYLRPAPTPRTATRSSTRRRWAPWDSSTRRCGRWPLQRYRDFEHELGPVLTRFAVERNRPTIPRPASAQLAGTDSTVENALIDSLAAKLAPDLRALAGEKAGARRCDQDRRRPVGPAVFRCGRIDRPTRPRLGTEATAFEPSWRRHRTNSLARSSPSRFAGDILAGGRSAAATASGWSRSIKKINWELFDRGVEAFDLGGPGGTRPRGHDPRTLRRRGTLVDEFAAFVEQAGRARNGKSARFESRSRPFVALRRELDRPFAGKLILWPRTAGPKGDLRQEMDTVLQVPGWSNIWTQPIINRIDMLSTGVRTQIGVKVFGPDLETINRVCKEIEQALKPIRGAQDVIAEPIMGKGYLEINIDREQAARYGVRVGDIQDTIEVALGGQVITQTVEGRDRFPVRIRYAPRRARRRGEVRRLLVSRGGMKSARNGAAAKMTDRDAGQPPVATATDPEAHAVAPGHAPSAAPLQVPLMRCRRRAHRRRPGHDQERERPAAQLCHAECPRRSRHGRLRRRGPAGRGREGRAARRASIWNGAASSSIKCAPPRRCA